MVGRGGKLNAVRKMSEIKLEEATSPSYPTLKAGSVWIVIKSRKVQLNRSKEDGGCRGKTQWEGKERLGSQPSVGKGCYASCQGDQTTYFGLQHCAPAYCADVKIHTTARVAFQQNTLIPSPPTPCHTHSAHRRKSISTPKNYHCPDCVSVYGQLCGFVSSVLWAGCRE